MVVKLLGAEAKVPCASSKSWLLIHEPIFLPSNSPLYLLLMLNVLGVRLNPVKLFPSDFSTDPEKVFGVGLVWNASKVLPLAMLLAFSTA